jgi:hypothetical protein
LNDQKKQKGDERNYYDCPKMEGGEFTISRKISTQTNFIVCLLFRPKVVCSEETKRDLKSIMRRYGNYVYNSKLLVQY